ncbi:MAG: DUF924 family protein [Rhizobiaceae bacterium]
MTGWDGEVLSFWFDETPPAKRFSVDHDLDADIARRFAALHARLMATAAADLVASPSQALAALIVLDQFSRNMFRGTAGAFAADPHARAIADAAISSGHDTMVAPERRMFFYLPFMHAENAADQDRCVALFSLLGNPDAMKFAHDHRDIIQRFGRFPHRNAALGRESTADEKAYLATAEHYGQKSV